MRFLTLRIIDRYLARELLVSFVAATAILLLVSIGGTVADLLNKIARGRIPAELLFSLIGLRTVDALTLLAPLAVFIGVQIAYGRLYRESEMAVFAASGLPVTGLLRPLALLAVPLAAVMALISFWLAPAAVRLSQNLVLQANRSLIIAGLEPGKFVELPNGDGMMYVESMSPDGTQFKKMFVASERALGIDKNTPDARAKATTAPVRINVITAADGELYHDVNGAERYLGLNNGFRVEGIIGQDNYRLLRYARNDVKLTDSEPDASADAVKRAAPTADLLRSEDLVQRTELHWRLAAPISTLVLILLALPLSKSSPRQPRYAGLIIAGLSWAIYYAFMNIARNQLVSGKLSFALGMWWVHVPVLLIALYLLWRSQQLPRPKPARAMPVAGAA
ncbi:MAG: LPS export ABC transporter permease LptF [Proteobacteria bacterium]|uniref:LPS export ABC transporter permease LptF n=1 Tax=Rudaea sp. TaxID=2136325 RepID=UPI001DAB6F7F|nr:LPS export ABC transporter permease LptF [Pseudomonadota bacterium]MBS0566707.1 LPS export ABC transporter permease LptF [Pseudomonadota bacterium]